MWYKLGRLVLKYKFALLSVLLAATVFMGYHASHIQIGYDFAKAVPTDNPKYQDYLKFKAKFGDDGTTMVLGMQTDKLYTTPVLMSLLYSGST